MILSDITPLQWLVSLTDKLLELKHFRFAPHLTLLCFWKSSVRMVSPLKLRGKCSVKKKGGTSVLDDGVSLFEKNYLVTLDFRVLDLR